MTQARWQRLTEWPLMGVAVIFLVAYSWEVIADLEGWTQTVAEIVQWATWAVFLIDYVVELALAEQRGRWFIRHLLDLATVILPFLRPLRLIRLVTLLGLLRRGTGRALRGRVVVYVLGATILLVWVAAVAILDAERGQGGGIQTIWDALWWAAVTITTVGYGDVYPVTTIGRLIAVAVMIGGITLIGVVTATLASWIIDQVNAEAEAREEREGKKIEMTSREVDELRGEIRALRAELSSREAPTPTSEHDPEVVREDVVEGPGRSGADEHGERAEHEAPSSGVAPQLLLSEPEDAGHESDEPADARQHPHQGHQ